MLTVLSEVRVLPGAFLILFNVLITFLDQFFLILSSFFCLNFKVSSYKNLATSSLTLILVNSSILSKAGLKLISITDGSFEFKISTPQRFAPIHFADLIASFSCCFVNLCNSLFPPAWMFALNSPSVAILL